MALPTDEPATDSVPVILKTLGFALVGLVGLLAIAAVFLFHPAWIVPISLVLTAAAMVIMIGTTRL